MLTPFPDTYTKHTPLKMKDALEVHEEIFIIAAIDQIQHIIDQAMFSLDESVRRTNLRNNT